MIKKNVFCCAVLSVWCVLGLSFCTTAKVAETGALYIENAKDNTDWAGVYSGFIPAASSPGIHVRIVLSDNETFTLQCQHEKNSDDPEHIDSSSYATGKFTWDEAGNSITLAVKNWPPYYRVGKGVLIQLDLEGNAITGNLADNYVLQKQP